MPPGQKHLAQYFTPLAVAEFAWQALSLLAPDLQQPRAIDPACGQGVFLQAALNLKVTTPERLWGCDNDPALQQAWEESGLLGAGARLSIHDGLLPLDDEIADESFDVAMGNPPFHSKALRGEPVEAVHDMARRFRLWRPERAAQGQLDSRAAGFTGAQLQRFTRFPSELLFLERFWQLCRPGGLIAIILPDGICANRRWQSVREWMLERLTILGVVGLPRGIFRAPSTTARTCLLFLRKAPPAADHRVLMAEVEEVGLRGESELPQVLAAWREGREISSEAPWLPVPGRE